MSSTLHWKPIIPDRRGGWGYPVKGIIAKKFFGHDGSCAGGPIEVDSGALEWFYGVLDATTDKEVESAMRELIEAIEEYGSIALFFES